MQNIYFWSLYSCFRPDSSLHLKSLARRPTVFSQAHKFLRSVLKGVFELLNRHGQEITLDYHIQICKQSAHEDAGEPAPEPEDRTMTVL